MFYKSEIMRIHFLGAIRNVTGSKHIVEVNGKKILLDCGMFHGHRAEADEKNRNLPFDAEEIDCMILSHAHIDHSGLIPILSDKGFDGNIYSTFATRDLCGIMLLDSAHIQADDAQYLNRKRAKENLPPMEPMYNREDVKESMKYFVAVGYDRPFYIGDGVQVTFREAGHILGSAQVEMEIEENKRRRLKLVFSGDLGRNNRPILKDPYVIHDIDYFIIESTYGNRIHPPMDEIEERLVQFINRIHSVPGKIIIPAFSIGRTQEVVFTLHKLTAAKKIPETPIYVDSPLSVNATEIFRLHPECYDEEANRYFSEDRNPFGFENIEYVRSVERSKELNDLRSPAVIISSSGMCEAGRILHHLKHNVENPSNIILIVGYCAENTLGKRIVEKEPKIKIFGEQYDLRAQVEVINSFSAHSDKVELIDYVTQSRSNVKQFFIVHGDEDQSIAFADTLEEIGYKATVPNEGDIVKI